MRKLLLVLIIILLLMGCVYLMTNGLKLFGIEINSVKGVQSYGNELDSKIQQATELTTIEFGNADKELNTAVRELKSKRDEYENKLEIIGPEKLVELLTTNRHEMQFIWATVGNYATENGLKLTLDLCASTTGLEEAKDLNFTLEGSYRNITNFLYDLENDENLKFTIENFKLVPILVSKNVNNEVVTVSKLQATFSVKNVNVMLG